MDAYTFLTAHRLAVIATSGPDGRPESALIAYVEDERLHLWFQTRRDSRKAGNLRGNPQVALVVGLDEDGRTLQYQGRARQLVNPEQIAACRDRFIAKRSPTTAEYLDRQDIVFYEVLPEWIGLSDYRGAKPIVTEHFLTAC